jgi:cation:H+ antiporter
MVALFFVLGLALLVGGAELLVRGASTLARRLGMAPLIVGLTVVAYGTSSPEMAVSYKAALDGQSGLAFGNVVGSNIFNVFFILGVSALILPLAVSRQLIRQDVPVLFGVSALAAVLALGGGIGRLEGAILALGAVLYTALLVIIGMRDKKNAEPDQSAPPRSTMGFLLDVVMALVGLALLVLGARWLVDSATQMARSFGISEVVIGLTVIAAGTSLPEVATSVLAAIRGERDIAVGNVVGSNIFNLLGVLGPSAILSAEGLPVDDSLMRFDVPVMLLAAAICLPIFFTGQTISRLEGAILLLGYIGYTTVLVLKATGHGFADEGRAVLLYGAVPAVLAFLGFHAIREFASRARHGHPGGAA